MSKTHREGANDNPQIKNRFKTTHNNNRHREKRNNIHKANKTTEHTTQKTPKNVGERRQP